MKALSSYETQSVSGGFDSVKVMAIGVAIVSTYVALKLSSCCYYRYCGYVPVSTKDSFYYEWKCGLSK